jgi:GR25 family glycosyltransferase involved in LPS biosynthesis
MSHNIDHIFYINLDHRNDRKDQIENELDIMSLKQKSERFGAFRASPGGIGCGLSHIGVLKLAKERGYKNVLILEDDFEFLVSKQELESQLTLFFDNVEEYNICMLGYHHKRIENSEFPFLDKVLDSQTASGYIVNHNFYDILIQNFEEAIKIYSFNPAIHWLYSIDQYWKKLQPASAWYAFKTRIGRQRPGFSDISGCIIDHKV